MVFDKVELAHFSARSRVPVAARDVLCFCIRPKPHFVGRLKGAL